jgi:hypothetical protein
VHEIVQVDNTIGNQNVEDFVTWGLIREKSHCTIFYHWIPETRNLRFSDHLADEHKWMPDVCERYLFRAKSTAENQYVSLRSVISTVIQRQDWKVEQISFITGARSVDKQDLNKNLKFFRVPEASINSIYSKLALRLFDVYTNTLKRMYNTRFSGGATRSETSSDAQPTPFVVTSLTHTIDTLPKPDNFKRWKKESPEVKDKQDNISKIDSI